MRCVPTTDSSLQLNTIHKMPISGRQRKQLIASVSGHGRVSTKNRNDFISKKRVDDTGWCSMLKTRRIHMQWRGGKDDVVLC